MSNLKPSWKWITMDKLARYSPGIEQGCFDLTAHTCFIIQRQHSRLYYSHSQDSEILTRILTRRNLLRLIHLNYDLSFVSRAGTCCNSSVRRVSGVNVRPGGRQVVRQSYETSMAYLITTWWSSFAKDANRMDRAMTSPPTTAVRRVDLRLKQEKSH